eukprot:scaffold7738_cov133-Cylindrotheca_fusiformis.AAC.30
MEKPSTNQAPAFDRDFVASISSSSTVLGQCLRTALMEMKEPHKQQEAQHEHKEGDSEEGPAPKRIKLDLEAVDSIMQSFGGAMADTQIKSNELLVSTTKQHESRVPRAILHARLDHYNRVGQNWRIAIDNVKIKRRHKLFDERPRRRKRVSFFRSDDKSTVPIAGETQILAYNDL